MCDRVTTRRQIRLSGETAWHSSDFWTSSLLPDNVSMKSTWATPNPIQMFVPIFEITRGGGIQTLHPRTRRVLKTREATETSVVQLLPLGQGVVVREDYLRHPEGVSNVYYVDAHLREQWRAELPLARDVYCNPVEVREGVLRVASWICYTCDLDPASGRLISSVFTK